MRKLFFATMISTFALVSCNQKAGEQEGTTTSTPSPEAAAPAVKVADLATAHDYGCGMDLEDGMIADTTMYNGKMYGFCASECKAEFLKDPEKLLSQQ